MSFLERIKNSQWSSFLARVEASRKPRYKEMLKPFYETPEKDTKGKRTDYDTPVYWDHLLDKVLNALKREDRIVWFLKKARATRPAFKDKAGKEKLRTVDLDDLLEEISHYLGYAQVNGFEKVIKYQFKDQTADQLKKDLETLTKKSEEEKSESARLLDRGDDKTFLKFDDGWEWHLLNRAGCEKEGAAMRHCGNVPSAQKGQRILSLREPITTKKGKKLWKPHATFIWNKDGSLGEMKGFANKKPTEKTYPYIVKLLENEKITKLKGGGYASSQNFKVKDLPEEMKIELLKKRPDLAPSGVDLDTLAEQINEFIEAEVEYAASDENLQNYDYVLYEDFDNLSEDEVMDYFDSYRYDGDGDLGKSLKILSSKFLKDVKDCCEIDFGTTNGISYFLNEEEEREIPDEFQDQISELTDDDLDELNDSIGGHISRDYISYGVDMRMALVVEEKKLENKVRELMTKKAEKQAATLKAKLQPGTIIGPEDDEEGEIGLFQKVNGKKKRIASNKLGLPEEQAKQYLKILKSQLTGKAKAPAAAKEKAKPVKKATKRR